MLRSPALLLFLGVTSLLTSGCGVKKAPLPPFGQEGYQPGGTAIDPEQVLVEPTPKSFPAPVGTTPVRKAVKKSP